MLWRRTQCTRNSRMLAFRNASASFNIIMEPEADLVLAVTHVPLCKCPWALK